MSKINVNSKWCWPSALTRTHTHKYVYYISHTCSAKMCKSVQTQIKNTIKGPVKTVSGHKIVSKQHTGLY